MSAPRVGALLRVSGLGALTAALLLSSGDSPQSGTAGLGPPESAWQETAWPFARDQWPSGRAFRCPAHACGAEMHLFVRPKIGFCDCARGVADQDELERVADLTLVTPRYAAAAPGAAVDVGGMAGWSGPYRLELGSAGAAAQVIAFAARCNVMVATLVAPATALGGMANRAALKLLSGQRLLHWARGELESS